MQTECRLRGGQRVLICADEKYSLGIAALAEMLGMDLALRDVRDGFRLQFGWTEFTFRELPDGRFQLCEPDFANDPLSSVIPSVNESLRVTSEQLRTSASLGEEPEVAVFDQKVVVSEEAKYLADFYFERTLVESSGDSGWYLGRIDSDRQGVLVSCRVYELMQFKPELTRYLALPTGYMIVFEGGQLKDIVDPSNDSRLAALERV